MSLHFSQRDTQVGASEREFIIEIQSLDEVYKINETTAQFWPQA